MPKLHVHIYPENKHVTIDRNENLLQAITRAGILLDASCGGQGTCGGCKVRIREGQASPVSSGMLSDDEKKQGFVLACQCVPKSSLVVDIPLESKLAEQRVVLLDGSEGDEVEFLIDDPNFTDEECSVPMYNRITLEVPQPTLGDTEDDLGRLLRTIRRETGIEFLQPTLDVLKILPEVLRKSGWRVTVSLAEGLGLQPVEINRVEPGPAADKHLGLAVDVGTTTVAAMLVDLNNGRTLAVKGTYNRQAVYGDDVISRIISVGEHPDRLGDLQKAVIDTINNLIEELCGREKIEPADIRAAACSGNTTMVHLLLGLNPANIRLEPYIPVANNIPAIRASDVGLKIHPGAWVQSIPGVSGYVGGDITSGILVSGMAQADELTLFIDIGTNGEMVLGNKDWLVACACSAGPAFEGGGIRHGMRAMQGAIEKVRISRDGSEVSYATVGGAPPAGICGSGLIDCISWLYKAGVIDRSGSFLKEAGTPRVRDNGEGIEFVLAWSGEVGICKDITISEIEIKNIIRSKAAVYAGIRSMLKSIDLKVEAIDRVVIAGGFGRYINIVEAVSIGLFPDIPLEKYTYVGNSSLKGARMGLLSRQARRQLEEIAKKTTYLELSEGNIFMEEFISALFIPHTDIGLFPSVQ